MNKFFTAAFLILVIGTTHAQYNYGLEEYRDEFTNEFNCSQRVDNSTSDDTGIYLLYSDSTGYGVMIIRDFRRDPNTWVFNSQSPRPLSGDFVYVRFSDGEVISGKPDFVYVERQPQRIDSAGFANSEVFIIRLLTSTGDIRVRFVGTHGTRDFTINESVVRTLANGFGQRCLGKGVRGRGA